ncbi:hypothetical protein, partial [Palleronia sp.]|uniref:hypothetical protein n=1 Tax=Palleronia sp. TaxID=1940284 RepID=UPI0035C82D3A
ADDTLAAMRCGLERLDRMRPPAVEGIVAAAEHIIARVDSGAFVLGQDSRRYARLALADFFTERRNAALNDLA